MVWGRDALAARIAQPPVVARDLLQGASGDVPDVLALVGCGGRPRHVHAVRFTRSSAGRYTLVSSSNPRSLRNFPMQGNGAEMLRLACCLATERGIEVCAPVHDAVLICAPLDRLDADIAGMRAAMAEASRIVLNGFELGTDVATVRYPDRYSDKRGVKMWKEVTSLIDQINTGAIIA